ncbi:MAG: murein transglycosylase A [Thermodesulfobacteriota bacterium]
MRKSSAPSGLSDDLPINQLAKGIEDNINQLHNSNVDSLTFGPKEVSKEDYILSLYFIVEKINSGISNEKFYKTVSENFDFYEVYGNEDWGEVFITSYYEPVLEGSKRKNSRYTQPLYSTPDDLVNVHLKKYAEKFERLSPIKDEINDPKSNLAILSGRIAPSYAEGTSKNIIPYYTREEIDGQGILDGKKLELAWVDPIDAFFLQVQGSGVVRFSNGKEIRLGYASQNGHPYVGIGKLLYDQIPKEEMTMQRLKSHLTNLPEDKMRAILYKNPSYIFFRELDGRPVTHSGTEVVDGRTIATDKSFYPKGALAYLVFPKPAFSDEYSKEPNTWEKTSRFVLDQDTGGAIKGTDRVDLFWGKGEEAGQHAGVLKNWGKLYYLVPKDELIERLKSN